jgi:hypothetical protein
MVVRIEATKYAATPNEAAFTANGVPMAATNAHAPKGSPRKVLHTTSVANSRPLALSSISAGTIAGRNAWADMSKTTSQTPTSVMIAMSIPMRISP